MWEIEYRYIEEWLDAQDAKTVALIFAALELLEREGPALGRPLVDTIEGSSIGHLKELRPASSGASEVRILFVFDPGRKAVMLFGGNKASGRSRKDKWSGWYKQAVKRAEEVYRTHLKTLENDDDQA